MRIALDLRRIGNPGIGRYMKCLAEAMLAQAPENEYLLILPSGREGIIPHAAGKVECITPNLPYYSLREQVELPRILMRWGADVLHSPHFNLPVLRVCPSMVTIHDVIYLTCPEDLPSRLGRLYYRGMMALAVRRATRVITDSEFSRQDIIRHLHCDPDKIEVVYPAVDTSFARVTDPLEIESVLARYGIDDDFILYAGIYKPRKNHSALLHAFRRFLESGFQAKLVIAGPLGEGESVLRRLAGDLGLDGLCLFLGLVPDECLRALYSAARVYACPSLYEGFGFTVLEAMSCGCPVVCSKDTALPETAGDAAIYADARNFREFGEALTRAFIDPELRQQLIARGFANVRRFSWAKAASQALEFLERAAEASGAQEVYS